MATGFEGSIAIIDTNPPAALAMANSHLMALMALVSARVSDAGSSYDSTALDRQIDLTREDIRTLRAKVHGVGKARFVPTVRADPLLGSLAAPGVPR